MASMEETPVQAPAMTFDPRARANDIASDLCVKYGLDAFDAIESALLAFAREVLTDIRQIVVYENDQWKGVHDDTHGAKTACTMILQKLDTVRAKSLEDAK